MVQRSRSISLAAGLLAALPLLLAAGPGDHSGQGGQSGSGGQSERPAARGAELAVTSRLADRRALVVGDRFYAMGAEDGSWPAAGFHTRGEMGGLWTPPIKLLDGMWFAVDGRWLGPATRFTAGWGYDRYDLPATGGVRVTRTDFAPDGIRAGLIGLTLSADGKRTVSLAVDAHSELMDSYPWGETQPSQLQANLPDTGAFDGTNLVFRDKGTPPVANATPHDWAAVVGSSLSPTGHALGPDFRGPQDPAVVCPASGPNSPPQPARCDDTAYGKGTGGQLRYRLTLSERPTTVWFAVGGSDLGPTAALAAQRQALADPAGLLAAKFANRQAVAANTVVDLPGDRLLQASVGWSKQNLADSVQEARRLQLRVTNAGTAYPPPQGTLPQARWIGAGWPDYPWIFGTDGEYTAFAAVASGQFTAIENHLRALQQVSDIVNNGSGKVVHEVTPGGAVYFGANTDPGNTDETAKFPSAVALVWRWTGDTAFRDQMYDFAVRNMHYIYNNLDADGDGWPEGLGNVERPGMGQEKLDVAVYTIRGLRDLADLAASKGDVTTQQWATAKADDLQGRFETTWWYGGDAAQYADSLADPGNHRVFQRHWIGLTPLEAELAQPNGTAGPLADAAHARQVLDRRQQACYSGTFGLYHTGTGPTSASGGNPGPSCDSAVSTVGSERTIFSLGNAVMAVAEGAYGRLGPGQQQRYTTANARIQLDPAVWEQPGAMPEIAPSPDFGANIDRKFTERSSLLQAWGSYGVLWPVVHQQLGVAPDLGHGRLSVVPQLPAGQQRIAGGNIRLGGGAIDVRATRDGRELRTVVTRRLTVGLTVGAVLPAGSAVRAVTLDGRPVAYQMQDTARGTQVLVDAGVGSGTTRLEVRLA